MREEGEESPSLSLGEELLKNARVGKTPGLLRQPRLLEFARQGGSRTWGRGRGGVGGAGGGEALKTSVPFDLKSSPEEGSPTVGVLCSWPGILPASLRARCFARSETASLRPPATGMVPEAQNLASAVPSQSPGTLSPETSSFRGSGICLRATPAEGASRLPTIHSIAFESSA